MTGDIPQATRTASMHLGNDSQVSGSVLNIILPKDFLLIDVLLMVMESTVLHSAPKSPVGLKLD